MASNTACDPVSSEQLDITPLGNRCPFTALTGLPQDTPLTSIETQVGKVISVQSIDDNQLVQKEHI